MSGIETWDSNPRTIDDEYQDTLQALIQNRGSVQPWGRISSTLYAYFDSPMGFPRAGHYNASVINRDGHPERHRFVKRVDYKGDLWMIHDCRLEGTE